MHCLESIVTTGICPDEGKPTSGFTITQAPGITVLNSAKIATETYTTGLKMLKEKKALSITQLRNDFIGAINSMNVIADIDNRRYDSGEFMQASVGVNPDPRGVVLHPTKPRGGLRKLVIHSIELHPNSSGDTTLEIIAGGLSIAYNITVVGGQVNVFDSNNLADFPLWLDANTKEVKVLVDQSVIPFSSAKITCMKGCNGSAPNPCAWADGWNGSNRVKDESYGVVVNFGCECDYSSVLCDNALAGELLWLKWQINIFQEHMMSNRFNGWVVYNAERIQDDILPSLYAMYNDKWNDFLGSLPTFLRSRRDDCFDCRQMRWVVSV